MSTEITLQQHCVVLKNGITLYIDADKISKLNDVLSDTTKQFININGQMVNRYEISGVFDPEHMEDMLRRKNGDWKCRYGNWHEKHVRCACIDPSKTEMVTRHVEGVGEVTYRREKK